MGKSGCHQTSQCILIPSTIANIVHKEKIWRGGVPLRHRTSIFPSDIEAIENEQADILICH